MLGGQRPFGRGDTKLWISHVAYRDHVIRGSSDIRGEFQNQTFTRFGGHRFCRRGDLLFLFCHVTSCDHMIRGSSDVIGEVSSLWVTILPSWWPQTLFKRKYFVFILSRDLTWLSGQRVTWHYRWFYFVISDFPAKFRDHRPFREGDVKLSICHVTSQDHEVKGSCDIMGEFCS